MGVDTPSDSIHLSFFTLGSWQSYMPSGGKLACGLYLAAVKDKGGKMGGRKLYARLDTALALADAKTGKSAGLSHVMFGGKVWLRMQYRIP